MRISLLDLTPATQYYVQVRARDGARVSDWSAIMQFRSDQDLTPPPVPSGLNAAPNGDNFVVTWTRPAGDTMIDFKHYELRASGNGKSTVIVVASETYTFTLAQNIAAFDEATSPVTFEVRSVDLSDNKSDWSASAVGTNPPPANVTGITGTAVSNGIQVRWNLVADTDVKQYNIYTATGASAPASSTVGTLAGSAQGTEFLYGTMSYTTDHWVSVRAVDSFGTTSTGTTWVGPLRPLNFSQVDTAAPAVPTGLDAVAVAVPAGQRYASVDASWTLATGASEADRAGYQLRYGRATTGPWTYLDIGPDTNTVRVNGLDQGVTYYFNVRAYDFSANYSGWSTQDSIATLTDVNAPPAPTGLIGSAEPTRISMMWEPVGNASSYEAMIATNSGYSTGVVTKTVTGTVAIFPNLTPETTYYPRVRAISQGGQPGAWAAPNPVGVTTPAAGQASYSFDDITGSLGTDRLTVIANTIGAEVLKADTAFNQNLFVRSTFTLGQNDNGTIIPGNIRSLDYNASTGVGFNLTNSGLDIQSGSIAARALKIQNSPNLMAPEYATFNGQTFVMARGGTISGSSYALSTDQKKFGLQSLFAVSTSTAAEATTFYLSRAADALNVPTTAGTDYIISAWVYPTAAGTINLGFRRYTDTTNTTLGNTGGAATVINPADSANPTALVANQWQRIYRVISNTPSDNAIMYFTVNNGMNVYVDGVQVEEKVAGLDTPSSFKPPGLTQIDGGIIRTGEIRSTTNVTTDGTTQPAWSLNMAGNMQINDAVVRGSIVVGSSSSTSPGSVSLQSYNWNNSSLGWAIKGDGTVDFFKGTFRDNLKIGTPGSEKFHVDGSNGNLGIGGTTATSGNFRVTGSDGSVYIGAGSLAIGSYFSVNSAGTITASSGTIGGFTFNSARLYADSGLSTEVNVSTGTWAFSAGGANSTAPFRVSSAGAVHASNMTVTGGSISGASLSIGSNFSVNTAGTMTASGATITGTLRTGTSGARVQMTGSEYQMFDSSGYQRAVLFQNGSWAYFQAGQYATSIQVMGDNTQIAAINGGRIYLGGSVTLGGDGFDVYSASRHQIDNNLVMGSGDREIWYGTGGTARIKYYLSGISVTNSTGNHNTGSVYCGTLYYSGGSIGSSQDFKYDIDVPAEKPGLKEIKQLKLKKFKMKPEYTSAEDAHKEKIGLIAEEVPEFLRQDNVDGRPGVDTVALWYTMLAGIQELQDEVETLRADLAALRGPKK